MDRRALQRLNHPQLGSSIKVEPIRDLDAISRIKSLLSDHPRDYCLFTMGINTAYRASELLSLNVGQVRHLRIGDRLDLKQSKNRKYRATTLNRLVIDAIQGWLDTHPDPAPASPFFISCRDEAALQVPTVAHMVKDWCRQVGLAGNYASHTLRKTWGYHQRIQNNAPIPLLMRAYGHASQEQTLEYLCIQDEEIGGLYEMEI